MSEDRTDELASPSIGELATLAGPPAPLGDNPVVDAQLGGLHLDAKRIDRFVVLRKLGQGAMGVVYAAYDETLDRRVAIKLLHRQTGEQSRLRLVREAQALARLSHPNVVQIYEIGEFEQTAFISMEFVDGVTLSTWLREHEPSRAQILAAFAVAGAGLAAAHHKGLVHRDFKPDNVMITGEGRVVVMDFGLAHASEDPTLVSGSPLEDALVPETELGIEQTARPELGATSQHSGELTATGTLIGTPAYTAPEQYTTGSTDARSDQFSFCVALWEALYRQRPFVGDSLAALCLAVTTGDRREPPRDADVPSWLRRVLERGLATEPALRWPDMDALLVALSRDPTRRRNWIAGVGAALVILAGGGWWANESRRAAAQAERARALASCEARAHAIDDSWSPARAAQLERGFAFREDEVARESWRRTRERLDDYTERWAAQRARLCIETEVEGSRAPDSAERMGECLDEHRAALRGLVDGLAGADTKLISRALRSASALPQLEHCEDPQWLHSRARPPAAVETRAEIVRLRAQLQGNGAALALGRYAEALTPAEQLLAAAESLAWPPLVAEAYSHLAHVQLELGEYASAERSAERAFFEAGAASHDLVALQAALDLVYLSEVSGEDYARGKQWTRWSEMLIARLGLERTAEGARARVLTGRLEHLLGNHEAALASYREGIEIYESQLGRVHPAIANTLDNIGNSNNKLGRYTAALEAFEQSIAIYVATLGPRHPDISKPLSNLAWTQTRLGREREAISTLERSEAIMRASLGPDHPDIGAVLHNIALLRGDLGELEPALADFEQALQIWEAAFGPNNLRIAILIGNMGRVQRKLGAAPEALASLERSLAIKLELLGPEHASTGTAHVGLGDCHEALGNFDEALAAYERGLAIKEAALGPEHVDLAEVLNSIGSLVEAQAQIERARESYARALEIYTRGESQPEERGRVRFGLARTLWELGEREAVSELLAQARDELDGEPDTRDELDAWARAREL